MDYYKNNKTFLCVILAILLWLIGYFIDQKNNYTTQEISAIAQIQLQKKETIAETKIEELNAYLKTTKPKNLFLKYSEILADLYKKEGISLYVYENDSLCFWSDNQPSIDLNAYTNENFIQLIKIRNGWFEYVKIKNKNYEKYTCIALISIKAEYDFENNYLENSFSSWLNIPPKSEIITPVRFLPHSVTSKFGQHLFEISRKNGLYKDKFTNLIASIFYLLGLIFIIISIYYFTNTIFKNKFIRACCFISICFLLRTGMIFYKIPNCFYATNIFNTSFFADASSFYFSLLGDVFINSLMLFIVSVYIYKQHLKIKQLSTLVKISLLVFTVFLLTYYSLNISNLIFSLINNSSISFNINRLFDFSAFTVLGITSVGLMFYGFYLILEVFIIQLVINFKNKYALLLITAILLFLSILYLKINNESLMEFLWPIPLVITSYLLKRFRASNNFINIGLIILLVTSTTTFLFNKYELLNKKNTYKALSYSLTDRQDIIAENEFSKITNSIKNDIKLKNLLSLLPLSSNQIEQKIKQLNFSGYFERYNVVLSLFKKTNPVFELSDSKYLEVNYFENQIKNEGFQTICDNLFYIDKKNNPIRYVGKIDLVDSNLSTDSLYTLYFQLDPKTTSGIGVFPDLLLDKSQQRKIEFKNISYSVYESNKLQINYGDIQYPLFYNFRSEFENDDEYQHYIYQKPNRITIIISDTKTDFWQLFTSNSYLFIYFSIIVLASISFNSLFIKKETKFNSLNNRIQFIFVSIVLLSTLAAVFGTIWVVSTQSDIKNKHELLLKSKSILNELQQSVGLQSELGINYKEYTTFTLKKLAQLFGTDIALFNNKGYLFATSQPAIYEQGLVSKFMDPVAFSKFKKNNTVNYSHKEIIGNLNYLSSYISFYNTNNKLLGYLNLPYFSRQKDLEKELSAYLTTLLNIYTILFIITTLIALFVSNLLTKPLRIIKQQISNTKFGKKIKPIIWNSQDEIGSLVLEYNAMIVELEKNAELLTQSEKENAWREMSKQVAHEIKNPLTPMKLNIQHLQRVVKLNPENISEKVDKVAEMLIQQIDTLSNIATEFSNFAKFPSTKLERINLADVLQNATNLFKESSKCIIELKTEKNLFVLIDIEQCNRALTNLIKNAEQSIPENKIGLINITANKISNLVEIKISDNGSGIPIAYYPKIFSPNFTTKNSGTGLGLTMVKNSINAFNGSIEFISELEIGTTFTITLPLIN